MRVLLLFLITTVVVGMAAHRPIGWVVSLGLPLVLVLSWRISGFQRARAAGFTLHTLGVVLVLGALDLEGLLCMAILFIGVVTVGGILYLAGALILRGFNRLLRGERGRLSDDHDDLWVLLPLVLLPLTSMEAAFFRPPDATVATRSTFRIDSPPEAVYAGLRFYESMDHDLPWNLSFGFPRPLGPSGPMTLGETQACRYDKGLVVKRCTREETGRALAFEVILQDLHFERTCHLLGGSYEMKPEGLSTLLTIETRYVAHLQPRILWEPVEQWFMESFHDYLFEGLRLRMDDISIAKGDDGATTSHR